MRVGEAEERGCGVRSGERIGASMETPNRKSRVAYLPQKLAYKKVTAYKCKDAGEAEYRFDMSMWYCK